MYKQSLRLKSKKYLLSFGAWVFAHSDTREFESEMKDFCV